MVPDVSMATQNFKRNLFKFVWRRGKKITLVCFLLLLKRERKNVTLAASFLWRPLAFLPVTLSEDCLSPLHLTFSLGIYLVLSSGRQSYAFSFWLAFCDYGFPFWRLRDCSSSCLLASCSSSALWWIRLKGKLPDGRNWWQRKLGLPLVGRP